MLLRLRAAIIGRHLCQLGWSGVVVAVMKRTCAVLTALAPCFRRRLPASTLRQGALRECEHAEHRRQTSQERPHTLRMLLRRSACQIASFPQPPHGSWHEVRKASRTCHFSGVRISPRSNRLPRSQLLIVADAASRQTRGLSHAAADDEPFAVALSRNARCSRRAGCGRQLPLGEDISARRTYHAHKPDRGRTQL